MHHQFLLTLGLVLSTTRFQTAQADVFVLANGGRLEGKLLNPDQSPRRTYEIALASAHLVLPAEYVRRIVPPHPKETAYRQRVASMPDTAAGNWETAVWCAANGMQAERVAHLSRVLTLDANHPLAREALGFKQVGDAWLTTKEWNAKEGLVSHNGEWRMPQELALEMAAAEREKATLNWRKQIRLWRSWLGQKRHADAIAEFRAVKDPAAAIPLIEILERDGNREARWIALHALIPLPVPAARTALAKLAVDSNDDGLREAAIQGLQARDDKRLAARAILPLLGDSDNRRVNRAAIVLGALAEPSAIASLIEALKTKHRVSPASNRGLGISFNSGAGGLSVGAPKATEHLIQNEAVLAALVVLAHERVNFGYDQDEWRSWHVRSLTPSGVKLRRDD